MVNVPKVKSPAGRRLRMIPFTWIVSVVAVATCANLAWIQILSTQTTSGLHVRSVTTEFGMPNSQPSAKNRLSLQRKTPTKNNGTTTLQNELPTYVKTPEQRRPFSTTVTTTFTGNATTRTPETGTTSSGTPPRSNHSTSVPPQPASQHQDLLLHSTASLFPHPAKSMLLIRAIGNSLPPRHSASQTLDNLDFLLEHEERFPNMTRHWFVNRIVDKKQEEQVLERLRRSNESFSVIPFDIAEYSALPYHHLPDDLIHSVLYQTTLSIEQKLMHHRLLYAINVNGVRNAMLDFGRTRSKEEYVLPWDGNCFVTKQAWSAMQIAFRNQASARYFYTPMDRLSQPNEALLSESYQPHPKEEPQIIFHKDSVARFDPTLRYGNLNKIELLVRLRVPGKPAALWDTYKDTDQKKASAMLPPTDMHKTVGASLAGWTTRLYSGNAEAEAVGGVRRRVASRNTAILRLIERLDLRAATELYGLSSSSVLFFNVTKLQIERDLWKRGDPTPPIRNLIEAAEEVLLSPDMISVDAVPEDNDANPQKNHFHFELQSMMNATTILALTGFITENSTYSTKAASILRSWFVEQQTRIAWDLDKQYSSNSTFPAKTNSSASENIFRRSNDIMMMAMTNLVYLLDAVKILESKGDVLSISDRLGLQEWFGHYRQWVTTTSHARMVYTASNHMGVFYDVQMAALTLYCNKLLDTVRIMHRSISRVQLHEKTLANAPLQNQNGTNMTDSESEGCDSDLLLLQGWSVMSRLAGTIGVDYWQLLRRVKGSTDSALCSVMLKSNPLLDPSRELCLKDHGANAMGRAESIRRWWPVAVDAARNCMYHSSSLPSWDIDTKWGVSLDERSPTSMYETPVFFALLGEASQKKLQLVEQVG